MRGEDYDWSEYLRLKHTLLAGVSQYKYFCLVRGINPRGEMLMQTDGQRNQWLSEKEFETKERRFDNLEGIQEFMSNDEMFVVEKKYTYPPDDY